jgi:hypothetical protein
MAAVLRNQGGKMQELEKIVNQLTSLMKAQNDTPKWIENIPGRRVPYFHPVDLNILPDSTSAVEGTATVSTDGPFVVTAIGAFFKKTTGIYKGVWGATTAFDSRIASGPTGQQWGFQNVFDQPNIISGDWAIVDRGSDRNWQHKEVASAVFSPQAGGLYVLPTANLFGRNSTVNLIFTPGVPVPYAGTIQMILFGYKIVQGDTYQP